MAILSTLWTYVIPFLVVLTVLVFVHEMGHYLVARWNGVRVETFSIGFGPELIGWTDRRGTRWKIAGIPLGGFVKFFGDTNEASAPDAAASRRMSPQERAVSFHHKTLGQRAAIVAAGPAANFVYAIVVLALLFMLYGQRVTPPEIGRVVPDGAAAAAGLEAGDVVLEIGGRSVDRFEDIVEEAFVNPGRPLDVVVVRDGDRLSLQVTPDARTDEAIQGGNRAFGDLGVLAANPATVGSVRPDSPASVAGLVAGDRIVAVDGTTVDSFERLQDIVAASRGRSLAMTVARGDDLFEARLEPQRLEIEGPNGPEERWLIGVQRDPRPLRTYGPFAAFGEAVAVSWDMVVRTVDYLGQMIVGSRGTEDLGGPLRIAQVSGEAAQVGIEQLVMLSVLLSLNLGLINLFPIPVLDGGHLLLYACEAVRGRPLTVRMQEYAFRLGLAMILTLTVFATWNDLVHLRVVQFVAGLFS